MTSFSLGRSKIALQIRKTILALYVQFLIKILVKELGDLFPGWGPRSLGGPRSILGDLEGFPGTSGGCFSIFDLLFY